MNRLNSVVQGHQGRRYRLGGQLGEGGYGHVYAAVDLEDHSEVAVKVLAEPTNDDAYDRFEGELSILVDFEHPHVVQVFDYGLTDDDHPFYVMERLSHAALQLIDRERTDEEVERVLADVLRVLVAYHALDGVHRDIKLGNILMDDRGNAVLADFGVARCERFDRRTMTRGAHGTLPYIAPEVFDTGSSAASDIYALGIVLWELWHGYLHEGEPGVPPQWVAGDGTAHTLYARMTHIDPSQRPSATGILAWLETNELRALKQPVEPTPWWQVTAAAAGLALVGLGLREIWRSA